MEDIACRTMTYHYGLGKRNPRNKIFGITMSYSVRE